MQGECCRSLQTLRRWSQESQLLSLVSSVSMFMWHLDNLDNAAGNDSYCVLDSFTWQHCLSLCLCRCLSGIFLSLRVSPPALGGHFQSLQLSENNLHWVSKHFQQKMQTFVETGELIICTTCNSLSRPGSLYLTSFDEVHLIELIFIESLSNVCPRLLIMSTCQLSSIKQSTWNYSAPHHNNVSQRTEDLQTMRMLFCNVGLMWIFSACSMIISVKTKHVDYVGTSVNTWTRNSISLRRDVLYFLLTISSAKHDLV